MTRKGLRRNRNVSERATLSPPILFVAAMLICSSSFFADAFLPPASSSTSGICGALEAILGSRDQEIPNGGSLSLLEIESPGITEQLSRRKWLSRVPQHLGVTAAATALATSGGVFPAYAMTDNIGEVTDKIFVDISGLSASASAELGQTQRIVLGLFGKDAPLSTQKLRSLHSSAGLAAPCKPLKEDFLIQREQLEANKVYRSCTENQDKGVNYDYAQIWRIVKDQRIDFGSLSGKFVAREFPTWGEVSTANSAADYLKLNNSARYLVAVRKGSDSGFGYTIFPVSTASSNPDFLDNYLVVGKVIEGDDVVSTINEVSVVNSAKNLNYMGIVGGGGTKSNAPNRSCRYGGPMYCNENKPLTKLTMFRTGIL